MSNIRIDDQEYEIDKMSEQAKNHLKSLQYTDKEIERLQAQLSIAKTARNAYAKALSVELETYETRSNSLN